MARPKGKLFALLAVFAAIGLVAASGAFTSVEADRSATVSVAGDSAALLQFGVVNSDVASTTTESTIQFDFSEVSSSSSGVNENAVTLYDEGFRVTNNADSEITLSWSKSGTNTDSLVLVNTTSTSASSTTYATGPITLSPGESYQFGFEIDTTDAGSDSDLDVTITFDAEETSS